MLAYTVHMFSVQCPACACLAYLQLCSVRFVLVKARSHLQDSLGGTANTALIICCSPSLDNAAETLSSLRFGVRARGIINSLVVNAARTAPSAANSGAEAELEVLSCALPNLSVHTRLCRVEIGRAP